MTDLLEGGQKVVADSGDLAFGASKRGLHWLAVSDKTGHGIALLESGAPLIGRLVPSEFAKLK